MPHFFFNLRSGRETLTDVEGQTLPDIAAAREEAMQRARDIVSEDVRAGRPIDRSRVFDVMDELGRLLLSVTFSEAVSEIP